MQIPGRIQGGVVVLEGGTSLPEGTSVIVFCNAAKHHAAAAQSARIQVPLVHTNRPGAVELTGERIAELMDDDDVSSGR